MFSGIQPTGNIHVGNYLAQKPIRRWAKILQSEYDNIFCIVDLHAITVPQDPQILRAKNREVAALLFAVGRAPKLSAVFIQSHISAHAENGLDFELFHPHRLAATHDPIQGKIKKHEEGSLVWGLFDYPALMAADIFFMKRILCL